MALFNIPQIFLERICPLDTHVASGKRPRKQWRSQSKVNDLRPKVAGGTKAIRKGAALGPPFRLNTLKLP
jgi:hypothetical protein